jgi:membrane fusion protein (multidrug efflux system)
MADHAPRPPSHEGLVAHPAPPPAADHPPAPAPARPARAGRGAGTRWLVIGGIVVAALAVGLAFGWHTTIEYFTTVSTDDAFVNGHVSTISARISNQVIKVLVDDNDAVAEGQVLVELDPKPFDDLVNQKRAALEVARAGARTKLAVARAGWYSVKAAQEQVGLKIATLRSDVADLHLQEANLDLATRNYNRTATLVQKNASTQEDLDQRQADIRVARQRVNEAHETIRRDRAALGLNPDADDPLEMPDDLKETFSAVQQAMSQVAQAAAEVGMTLKLYGLKPTEWHKQLEEMDNDINKTLDRLAETAPAVVQARRDLEDAERQRGYCTIRSPIAGVVNKRNVNPGNQVAPGQGLMTIRAAQAPDVWVDANFKETEIKDLKIGHKVDLYLDAYPGRKFEGRVSGFAAGTGSATALLPPENATGNYVKVVQRLPVRIDLVGPVPEDAPFFIGLSVTPVVRVQEPVDEAVKDAGKRLLAPRPAPAAGDKGADPR